MTPSQNEWQHLAEQASIEMDPDKLLNLVTQLNHVLGEQEERSRHNNTKAMRASSFTPLRRLCHTIQPGFTRLPCDVHRFWSKLACRNLPFPPMFRSGFSCRPRVLLLSPESPPSPAGW